MNLEHLLRSVQRQQGGVLLDTNVLLLWLMHAVDPGTVAAWKKTEQFTANHVRVLNAMVTRARRLVTTPHVLTEVTNHSVGIPNKLRESYWSHLRSFIANARERSIDARVVACDGEFSMLGLTDLALALLRPSGRPFVVTVDGPLTVSLERRGLPVINLNHHAFG